MARRKKLNHSKIITYMFSIILSFGVISLIYIFFLSGKKDINLAGNNYTISGGNNNANTGLSEFYNNAVIYGTGIIKPMPYNIKIGSSYKLISNDKKFFIKSENYLLGNYENKIVYFSGIVVGLSSDDIPILNITLVKEKNESNEDENNISTGNDLEPINKDSFLNYSGLIINLENISDNLKVKQMNGAIYIYKELTGNVITGVVDTTGNNIINYLKITIFKCNNSNSITDCKGLIKSFNKFNFEKLINNNGIVFYKLPETENYEALSEEYGYYFYPITGDFSSLINSFSFENTKQVKMDVIKNTCVKGDIMLQNILNVKFTGDLYEIVGLDQNANKIICKLKLTNNGKYIATLLDLNYLRDESSFNEDNLNKDDYLIYSSRAYGFKVYMPKWVKYKSDLVNLDFGISGLKCLQVVNISHRKTGNLLDPDVKVYYCKSDISKYLIQEGLIVQKNKFKVVSNKSKIFIIFYKENSTANKILNYLKVF